MIYEMRKYQHEAVEAARNALRTFRSCIIKQATGTGKTIVACAIIEKAVEKGKRVLFVAHTDELCLQSGDKLTKSTGIAYEVEKAERTAHDKGCPVVVASVQSLSRQKRLDRYPRDFFDLAIIDEGHRGCADSYVRVFDHFHKAKLIALTATPFRSDDRALGEVFDEVAFDYGLEKAIEDGWLVPIVSETIPLEIDFSHVSISAGDYKASDVEDAITPVMESVAQKLREKAPERKIVVFLPLISASKRFTAILCEHGFDAEHVDGKSRDRQEILKRFSDKGAGAVLCNSNLLTEGWDEPSVDCIVVLSPTRSTLRYCLDSKTEILTPSGWAGINDDIKEAASFNKKTGAISFNTVLGRIARPVREDEYFYSISGPSCDIRVTNNHSIVYDTKRKTGWKVCTAERAAMLSSGMYIPVSGELEKQKGAPLSDDDLRFIGWVMTDGSINRCNNQIVITQGEHQPWLEEIQKCIDGCGFKNRRYVKIRDSQFKSNSRCIVWTISKGRPIGSDKHLSGWGRLDPYLSKDFSEKLMWSLSSRQLGVLLHAIHLGDGSKQAGQSWTRHSYHISSGNKTFAERLQIVCVLHGYRANVSTFSYNNKKPIYLIHIKKTNRICVGSKHDSRPRWKVETHTDELCWCVETVDGTIVTRRNGKVSILGNCQMIGRGTRISPETGKENLYVPDFLWHGANHNLCHPACLIAKSPEVAEKMTEIAAKTNGKALLSEVEEEAHQALVSERESALAESLKAFVGNKSQKFDPVLQAVSVFDDRLVDWSPETKAESAPVSASQIEFLDRHGFDATGWKAGYAQRVMDIMHERREQGLASPKQVRCLMKHGYPNAHRLKFEEASGIMDSLCKKWDAMGKKKKWRKK